MSWKRILLGAFFLILAPILYIAGFNFLVGTSVAITLDNWIRVFLVEILAFLVFVGAWALSAFLLRPFGRNGKVVALVIALLFLPVLFIWAFNLVVGSAVPFTLETYVFVGLLLLAVAIFFGLVEKFFY